MDAMERHNLPWRHGPLSDQCANPKYHTPRAPSNSSLLFTGPLCHGRSPGGLHRLTAHEQVNTIYSSPANLPLYRIRLETSSH
jgi:hypothetical protein